LRQSRRFGIADERCARPNECASSFDRHAAIEDFGESHVEGRRNGRRGERVELTFQKVEIGKLKLEERQMYGVGDWAFVKFGESNFGKSLLALCHESSGDF
jgi:hypothetical protein